MKEPIFSTKDDNLETILEKINSGKTIKENLEFIQCIN